jgi:hypothetical protein
VSMETPGLSGYSNRVALLLQGFLFRNNKLGHFTRLVELLEMPDTSGCHCAVAREQIKHAAWLTLVHQHERTRLRIDGSVDTQTLAGILHNARWRACIQTEKGFHAFALLVARCLRDIDVDRSQNMVDTSYSADVENLLQSCLNEWLSPQKHVVYNEHAFAAALFGDAWYALVFLNRPDYLSLADLMEKTRPPVVVGSFSGDVAQQAKKLPHLSI